MQPSSPAEEAYATVLAEFIADARRALEAQGGTWVIEDPETIDTLARIADSVESVPKAV